MVLVTYASRHGSTVEIAQAVADALVGEGLDAVVLPAHDVMTLDAYEAVVLGSSIYVGQLHRDALRFLERHAAALRTTPFAVFGAGPRTLDPDDVLHSRIQVVKALNEFVELEPVAITVFGGVVDPTVLRWPFNRMEPSDARDWAAVAAWARGLARCKEFRPPAVKAL